MTIHTLRALKDNFVYAIVQDSRCAVVDPGEAAPVEDFLKSRNLDLTHVLLTHHHPDHVAGAPELARARPDLQVWCSRHDRARIPFATVTARNRMPLWDQTVRVLEIPGHTLGHIAYHLPDSRIVFVGDTLFSAGCGRLFEGTPAQMFQSMAKLKALPQDTRIYFGHEYTVRNLEFVARHFPDWPYRDYLTDSQAKLARHESTTPTTLKQELEFNPFLKARTVKEFAEWRELRNSW
ncbi:MAG TPA: hydroxyacylglutathione hydrolase [Bdellovibrionales bacterium]|nr:hydroxyacylglutathione hydrolase [Bdellovibrionales bacterium]